MLQQNNDDTWVLGLSALNSYTMDFKIEESPTKLKFAMYNENGAKAFSSTAQGLVSVDALPVLTTSSIIV